MDILDSKSILLSSSNLSFDFSSLERLGELIAKDIETFAAESFADFGSSFASVLQIFCILNILKNAAAISAHLDFIQKKRVHEESSDAKQNVVLAYEISCLLIQSGLLFFSTFKNQTYEITWSYFDYLKWELVEDIPLTTGRMSDWFIGFEIGAISLFIGLNIIYYLVLTNHHKCPFIRALLNNS